MEAAALVCSHVGCLAVPHNSDRDVAAARTLKRALVLIGTVGLNSRKPHVRAALGAPRVEDTFGSNTHRSIKHGATLAETLSQGLDASAIHLDHGDDQG